MAVDGGSRGIGGGWSVIDGTLVPQAAARPTERLSELVLCAVALGAGPYYVLSSRLTTRCSPARSRSLGARGDRSGGSTSQKSGVALSRSLRVPAWDARGILLAVAC